ncbi:MAG: DUF4331 domain-containing protein [Leptolyngbya foveolarum]|uniref:DUF4331 domain-containing protein n=1 Tax=Leptolyngbya foveolarum TaxID=47253 RepID=A0A2W4U0E2_9CYAN|nr:MAG: DUF4331 domain-containing protein [Leptolyngbya foveolarum]
MKRLNESFTLNWKKALGVGGLLLGLAATAGTAAFVNASDHDDGEKELKGRNLNLTDLYVFREGDQNPSASADNLVFILDTNPRSLAQQQYYFSNKSRYEFMVTRVADKDASPTGMPDVTLQFTFAEPDAQDQQPYTMTVIADGNTSTVTGKTTPVNAEPMVTSGTIGDSMVKVFAGLREDPFFFDVEQFFRVRAGALGIGPAAVFRDPDTAIDFTTGYNVNAIAVQIPTALLAGDTGATTFDVWTTISTGSGKTFNQVERLARPVVNEGLVFTNDFLNTLNAVTPAFEASALAGQEPAASAAAPIFDEVKRTLMALGNDEARTNTLIGAFLPDVMRIDTTIPSGYGSALNAQGSPIAGRLLKDDVIDTTLSVLTNGAITSDNVSYEGIPGNFAQGHDPLISDFPYLAPAN